MYTKGFLVLLNPCNMFFSRDRKNIYMHPCPFRSKTLTPMTFERNIDYRGSYRVWIGGLTCTPDGGCSKAGWTLESNA